MERRLFEPLVAAPGPGGDKLRAALLPVSLVIHAVVVGVVVLAPILMSEELPPRVTHGNTLVPAVLAPPPPPPRGISPSQLVRHVGRAESPMPPTTNPAVFSAPASLSELPPAENPGLGLGDLPVCEGCVPWGVDGGVPIEEPSTPDVAPAEPVFRVGTGVEPPVRLRYVEPEYPELAILTRVEGVVIVECRVDKGGHVVDARVLRGHPLLDGAALDAIRQWRYRPSLLNGEPVSVIMTVTVRFRLRH